MTATIQEQKFRKFIQSETFSDREDHILKGQPVIALSPTEGEPWHLTTEQMEKVLREYYPDLSCTTHGERCVIFFETDDDTDRPQDRPTEPPTFYVYAGYYELYLSTQPMPEPYMYQVEFCDIDEALQYIEDADPENTVYCENVKDYLPTYLYEWNQDNDYEYFTF